MYSHTGSKSCASETLIYTDKSPRVITEPDGKNIAQPAPTVILAFAQSSDNVSEAAYFANISGITHVLNDFQEVSVYH